VACCRLYKASRALANSNFVSETYRFLNVAEADGTVVVVVAVAMLGGILGDV
jgi:hypothetical protein